MALFISQQGMKKRYKKRYNSTIQGVQQVVDENFKYAIYAMSKYFLSKTYWDTWFQKSKHKRFVIFLKAQKNVDTS